MRYLAVFSVLALASCSSSSPAPSNGTPTTAVTPACGQLLTLLESSPPNPEPAAYLAAYTAGNATYSSDCVGDAGYAAANQTAINNAIAAINDAR